MINEKQRQSNLRRYNDRKAKGLCQYCDNPALPGKIRCETHRQITKDYCAGRRDIRKITGLCANLGFDRAKPKNEEIVLISSL